MKAVVQGAAAFHSERNLLRRNGRVALKNPRHAGISGPIVSTLQRPGHLFGTGSVFKSQPLIYIVR